MNKIRYIIFTIGLLFLIGISLEFLGSLDQTKEIEFKQSSILKKQDTTLVMRDSKWIAPSNVTNMFAKEPSEPPLDEQQKLELFIQNAAIQNIPIDLVTLGRLKEYYINANDLYGYQRFIESLSDSYEMKNELLSDVAFLYLENGQTNESINLIQNLSSRNTNDARLKYYKSDIYLGAGNTDVAINSLLEAAQISEEPYQYERIAEILEEAGNTPSASSYVERADALKAIMHHDD